MSVLAIVNVRLGTFFARKKILTREFASQTNTFNYLAKIYTTTALYYLFFTCSRTVAAKLLTPAFLQQRGNAAE